LLLLSSKRSLRWQYVLAVSSLPLLALALFLSDAQKYPGGLVTGADALARYLLAVPGGILAGLALILHADHVKRESYAHLARNFRWAGLGFGLYGITQIFVPATDLFLASGINAAAFQAATGLPIQAIRAALAILVTVNLIRAIQTADQERENQLRAAQKARVQALEQVQHELLERASLRRELMRHIVIAQEDERARIARELHDQTAQELTAISLNLATLRNLLPANGEVKNLISRLQELSQQMSQGIYRMVGDLRPAQLDDLGLVPALKYLVDEGKELFDLEITVEVKGPRQRLDALVETVIFRVAQEALTNVSRHAQTRQAKLQLDFEEEQVILRVRDEGAGFDLNQKPSPPHGWGLAGMRERSEALGGTFQIWTSPGKGTTVEARIPLVSSPPQSGPQGKASQRFPAEQPGNSSEAIVPEEANHEKHSSYAG
jgi:signal transduction histidine kinase